MLRARAVAARAERQPAHAARIRRDLAGIAAQLRHRRAAGEQRVLSERLGRRALAAHLPHVRHRPSRERLRQLQPEVVPRLKQHALCLAQPLPHGAVRRLPEIAALRVLLVRPPGDKRDAHIRARRAEEHAAVLLFHEMREHEPLPVAGQCVLAAHRVKDQPAAGLAGL